MIEGKKRAISSIKAGLDLKDIAKETGISIYILEEWAEEYADEIALMPVLKVSKDSIHKDQSLLQSKLLKAALVNMTILDKESNEVDIELASKRLESIALIQKAFFTTKFS